MKTACIIVGAGTYGQVYAEYLKENYNLVGFIDDDLILVGTDVNGIPVLGNFDYLLKDVHKDIAVFVPIGNNKVRVALLNKLIEHGFNVPSFIHSTANIHQTVKVGKAVYILGATNIMPLSVIENFVMISMGVNVAHHTSIGNGSFLSQGANIGASIIIKELVFAGIGSTIMTGVKTVGHEALVGAGAMILRDVPDYAVVVGNPGKLIKYNDPIGAE